MEIAFLKKNEINEFSEKVKEIILSTPYYSKIAKREEIKKYKVSELRKKLKDKDKIYLVAKTDNKIIGFLNGYFDCETFWVEWAGVEKNSRRKGIAINLNKFLENNLKKSNIHKIWCDCRTNNKESINLLKKLKFKKIALVKRHWYKHDFYLWYKFI